MVLTRVGIFFYIRMQLIYDSCRCAKHICKSSIGESFFSLYWRDLRLRCTGIYVHIVLSENICQGNHMDFGVQLYLYGSCVCYLWLSVLVTPRATPHLTYLE